MSSVMAGCCGTVRRLRFLLHYCWMDARRPRELLDLLLRLCLILFLFVVLMAAAAVTVATPRLAKKIIEDNKLLRLVKLESTGSFPISESRMQEFTSLHELGGEIVPTAGKHATGRSLVAGVSPNRWTPLLLYRSDGQVNRRWTDAVHQVYSESHPGLPSGDQLFPFWGIRPLEPLEAGEVPRIVVTTRLLASLGFDIEEFEKWISTDDPRAALKVRGQEGWDLRLTVERIDEFPDQHVSILIPTRLARMVEAQDPRLVADRRYRRYELSPAPASASTEIEGLQKAINAVHGGGISIRVGTALSTGDSSTALHCELTRGLEVETWSGVGKQIEAYLGASFEKTNTFQEVICGSQVDDRWLPELRANMATVFVREYSDIPEILAYLEQRRDSLKVRVLNATNLEFVRTVLLSTAFAERVISCIALMFLLSCLTGIGYSALALIQRKIGEVGILRAFGAKKSFIAGRFVLEFTAICLLAACTAWNLLNNLILPWANARLIELSPAFRDETLILRCGVESVGAAVLIWLVTVVVVLLVITKHIRECPSTLLSMRD